MSTYKTLISHFLLFLQKLHKIVCVCVVIFVCVRLQDKLQHMFSPPSYYPPSPSFLKQLKYGLVRRAAPCQNARKIAAKLCFCYARKKRLKKNFNILCLVLMESFWMINIGLCKWLNSLQHIFRCKKIQTINTFAFKAKFFFRNRIKNFLSFYTCILIFNIK